MKKPRVALKDPNTLSLDQECFNLPKAALGKPCKVAVAVTRDGGQIYSNVTGIITAVDSRLGKGGKDGIYVGIRSDLCEFLLYAEFKDVEVFSEFPNGDPRHPHSQIPRPGPVLSGPQSSNGYMKS